MAMDGLRINQSNREFWSRYTIIIDIRELTLSFLYVTGTGMVIFLFLITTKSPLGTSLSNNNQKSTNIRGNVSVAQMENKTLKGGNECDQG